MWRACSQFRSISSLLNGQTRVLKHTTQVPIRYYSPDYNVPGDQHKAFFFGAVSKLIAKRHDINEHTVKLEAIAGSGNWEEFLEFIEVMRTNRVAIPGTIVRSVLFDMAQARQLDAAHKLLNKYQEMKLRLDHKVFISLVNASASVGDVKGIETMIAHMKLMNLEPDIDIYNGLISGLAKKSDTEGIFTIVEEMRQAGITPNINTNDVLLQVYSQKNLIPKARAIYKAISHHGAPTTQGATAFLQCLLNAREMKHAAWVAENILGKVPLDDTLASVILKILTDWSKEYSVLKLLEMMGSSNLKLTTAHMNSVVGMYLRKDQGVKCAEDFIDDMEEKGIVADVRTYMLLVDAHTKARRLDEAVAVLASMREKGVEHNKYSYSALVNAYVKKGDIARAAELVDQMRKDKTSCLDAAVYNTIINGYLSVDDELRAKEVIQQMIADGVPPDESTYAIFVKSYTHHKKLDEALLLVQEMVAKGVKPGVVTYTTLLNAFIINGMMDKANHIFDYMQEHGLEPTTHTYNTLLRGLSSNGDIKNAIALIQQMRTKRVATDYYTYSPLAYACIHAKDKASLLKVVAMLNADRIRLVNPLMTSLRTFLDSNDGANYVPKISNAPKDQSPFPAVESPAHTQPRTFAPPPLPPE